jgi:hypothetical protein
MTAQDPGAIGPPPYPTETRENPAFVAWVERRAIDLCTDHDAPYFDERPCAAHLQVARHEGLDSWELAT